MNDDDLRRLLPTLDRIDPMPPDKVERLWAELEGVLEDRAPTNVATLVPRVRSRSGPHSWITIATVAAAAVAVVAGVALLTPREGPPTSDRDPAIADVPVVTPEPSVVPVSTAVTDLPAATVDEACRAFQQWVADRWPFDSLDVSVDEVEALTAWVDGLGTLLSDIDRVGRPSDSADEYLSIQLLRTALRATVDEVEAGNWADAATGLADAWRHLEAIQRGDAVLTGCVPASAG